MDSFLRPWCVLLLASGRTLEVPAAVRRQEPQATKVPAAYGVDRHLPALPAADDFALRVRAWARSVHAVRDDAAERDITPGDIAETWRTDQARASAWLEQVADEALREWLGEVLCDSVHSGRWKPSSKDRGRDGFWRASSLELQDMRVHQMSVLVWSTPEKINAADRIFADYLDDRGAKFKSVRELADQRHRARDGADELRAYQAELTLGLPWPFGQLRYVCAYVDRFGEDGEIASEFYDTGRVFRGFRHFRYFRGRNCLLPLRNSAGDVVATAAVTAFAMDVDNVPDGTGDHLKAMQQGLGNLKLRAER
jgi:hypothetical protein